MQRKISRIIAVFHEQPLSAEMHSVRTRHKHCVCLAAAVNIVIIIPVLKLYISCIVQVHFSVLDKSAP